MSCAPRPEEGSHGRGCPREAISIVVPCYNEAEVFPYLQKALAMLADCIGQDYDVEIILVDDGRGYHVEEDLRVLDDGLPCAWSVSLPEFRAPGGPDLRLRPGYGDAVVCMDADLQDPPEVVLEMIRRWREGADVVYGVRANREGETAFKLWTAKLFYRLIRAMGAEYVREDAGDFRLLSRRSLEALKKMREEHRFIRGMVGWIGFRTAEVSYERKTRMAGTTKYPFQKMLFFALNAIVSFSSFPLRLAYVMAFGLSAMLMSFLVYTFCMHMFYHVELVPGWTSLILSIMAFGVINLFCLGIIGEYVGRIYEQSKQRPLYLIGEDTHWVRR